MIPYDWRLFSHVPQFTVDPGASFRAGRPSSEHITDEKSVLCRCPGVTSTLYQDVYIDYEVDRENRSRSVIFPEQPRVLPLDPPAPDHKPAPGKDTDRSNNEHDIHER